MKCKNCGSVIERDVNFCTVCGAAVEKKPNKVAIAVIVSVLATVLLCVIVFAVLNHFSDNEDEYTERAETMATTEDYDMNNDIYGDDSDAVQEDDYLVDDSYDYSYETGSYILEGSDTRYISSDELLYLSENELCLARNEIYARHGRVFEDDDIRNYFLSQSWYNGTIAPEDFREDMLSEVEKHNIEKIKAEEKRR